MGGVVDIVFNQIFHCRGNMSNDDTLANCTGLCVCVFLRKAEKPAGHRVECAARGLGPTSSFAMERSISLQFISVNTYSLSGDCLFVDQFRRVLYKATRLGVRGVTCAVCVSNRPA